MTDLNDYELDRSGDSQILPPPRRSSSPVVWAAVIVAVLAVGVGIWNFASRKPAPSPAAVTPPAASPAAAPQPLAEPRVQAADIELPPLPETDPLVRELVARLSSHPTIAAWLTTNGLIANFTVVTLTIAEGRMPSKFLQPITPRGRFRTSEAGQELRVDPRSYDRYSLHADAIGALDAAGTASLYLTLKPRIDEAYRDLGYPDGNFDRVLERAIGVLLATPRPADAAALEPNGVTYAYSDAKLESLSPVQKQFLRLGPRNGDLIRGKLEEIAANLGLRPGRTGN